MDQWEHHFKAVPIGGWPRLKADSLIMGAEGWQVVGIAGYDPTFGTNELIVAFKRPIVPPPPPDDPAEGWKPDPCGRWQVRYWNGRVWTAHVAKETGQPGGETGADPPTLLSPPD